MNKYAVIDGEGNVVNIVVWDGESDWTPPDGTSAVEDDGYAIGGMLIDGEYTPPKPELIE